MKIALHAASLTALIALAFLGTSTHAQDAEKVDARVKSVEAQLEAALKPVESDAKRAKEAYLAAYKKECQARSKALEMAVSACDKKIKLAKDASDNKSVEALTAKKSDLEVELEAWKTNAGKQWDVRAVEREEAEKAVGAGEPKKEEKKLDERKVAGRWVWNGQLHVLTPDHKWTKPGGTLTGTWKVDGDTIQLNGMTGEHWAVIKNGRAASVGGEWSFPASKEEVRK